ncbi:MAG: choice-of-anchor L domain-containing protein, partial [Bacteroidota bacterium]
MKFQQRSLFFVGFVCLISTLTGIRSNAQVTPTANTNAAALAQTIAGPGVTVSNASLICSPKASGTFTAVATAIGITEGISLSTGDVTKPNVTGVASSGTNLGFAGYAPLNPLTKIGNGAPTTTNDACRLEFDVIPTTRNIEFKFVFGSDEYPTFIDDINDVFAFFISGPGIVGQRNIGVVPGTTTPITISTINAEDNAAYFTNYQRNTPTGYMGTTKVIAAKSEVIPCQTYRLILAIADAGDGIYDSNVWIEKNSLVSVGVNQTAPITSGTLTGSRIYENCDSATFKFTLPSPATDNYGFKLAIKGTATNGVDYRTIVDTLWISKGKTDTSIVILPKIDTNVDPGETVTICVLEPCTNRELFCQTVTIEELQSTITPETTICVTDSAQLAATNNPNYRYKWTPAIGLSNDAVYNPKASPPDTTEYTVTVSDNGCSITKKVKINIIRTYAGLDDSAKVCENGPTLDLFTLTTDAPTGGYWIDPTGARFTNPYNPPIHNPGKYLYAVSQNGCPEDTSAMVVTEIMLPNAGADGRDTLCKSVTN